MTTAPRRRRRRIVGIDPGLTRCGIGVIEQVGSSVTMVAAECVRTGPEQPIEQRLASLYTAIVHIFEDYSPSEVAVERVLFSANVRTAMGTGQAAGVALLAAGQAALTVQSYSPNEVKQTVAGDGAASKDAVARMVCVELGLDTPPRPVDVTDALAVALTHAARSRSDMHPVVSTTAATVAAEHQRAARAGRGGWEAVLGDRIASATAVSKASR